MIFRVFTFTTPDFIRKNTWGEGHLRRLKRRSGKSQKIFAGAWEDDEGQSTMPFCLSILVHMIVK